MAIDAIQTYQNLGLSTTADKSPPVKKQLGQDEFLKLMTTQMTHQDPNKPMENGNFLAQMAQFSTVEGIGTLNKSFSSFASSLSSGQSLQAASLVGQSVLVPSKEGLMSLTKPLSGEAVLNGDASDVQVNFLDSNGQTVKTIDLGRQSAGQVKFQWDGSLQDGTYTNPGVYRIQVNAQVNGQNTALQTFVNANVESVDLSNKKTGIQLQLAGLNSVNFNQVKKIF